MGINQQQSTPTILQTEAINNYRFSSFDEKWHVNLTSTFLALSTTDYERWEAFLTRLRKPLQALVDIYRPSFYERIGLRYIDIFQRSSFGLPDEPWSELIKPFALGFLSDDQFTPQVQNQKMFVQLDIGNNAVAQINASKGSQRFIQQGFSSKENEEVFIVDSDMYFMRKKITELDVSLDYLHDYSTKLLRSIITEKLHYAMKPEVI